jgi:hypothetical protein
MNNIVEKVAALRTLSLHERAKSLAECVAYPGWVATETEIDEIVREFEAIERNTIAAVLDAIAEPTEAMLQAAGCEPGNSIVIARDGWCDVGASYLVMIAALREELT